MLLDLVAGLRPECESDEECAADFRSGRVRGRMQGLGLSYILVKKPIGVKR
jgi:hypothetical protein